MCIICIRNVLISSVSASASVSSSVMVARFWQANSFFFGLQGATDIPGGAWSGTLCCSTQIPLILFEYFCIRRQLCLRYRKHHKFFLKFTWQQGKVQYFEQKCILGHSVPLHHRTWITLCVGVTSHHDKGMHTTVTLLGLWPLCVAFHYIALHPLHLHAHRCSPKHMQSRTHTNTCGLDWIGLDFVGLDETGWDWII